jgi:hypothetical protein
MIRKLSPDFFGRALGAPTGNPIGYVVSVEKKIHQVLTYAGTVKLRDSPTATNTRFDDRAGSSYGEPRRGSMNEIKHLRLTSP